MKVLVTGANGFIGQYVLKALEERGHEAIGLDFTQSVRPPWIHADITHPLEKIPNLDAVIHLAAMANPRECDATPIGAFAVNVNGTNQVLKMALESGAKKIVFSSSAHVYDIPPKYLPTDESHPLRLNNTYTTTKILGEQLCQLYWENHGLSYCTLRLFNAYGPG
jgi:UDP-glucose 4-epimerase